MRSISAAEGSLDLAVIVGIEFVYAVATLILVSLGLAIVFGMMRIINLAHGEFMVMGSYSATVAFHHGVNIWIAILVVPPVVVGVIGLVIERLIIRHLYGRMVETMLATLGPEPLPRRPPDHDLRRRSPKACRRRCRASASAPTRRAATTSFVIALSVAIAVAASISCCAHSRLGLLARGTMQNADMAEALGTNTSRSTP